MKLSKVTYKKLNSKQQEIYNYQKVAGLLNEYGFNCIKLADDWKGADFLAHHKDGKTSLKVQLKSRITISKKYRRKSLFMAFPIKEQWYLIKHDLLIELIRKNTSWLTSQSWKKRGAYSSDSANPNLVRALANRML